MTLASLHRMSLLEEWEETHSKDHVADTVVSGRAQSTSLQADAGEALNFNHSPSKNSLPPLFSLQALRSLQPGTDFVGSIVTLCASNNVLVVATDRGQVLRLNVLSNHLEDLEVTKKPEERIHKVFLDPLAIHLIITLENGDNYYQTPGKKPKLLGKFRGATFESVAWNKQNQSATTTGEILIGTRGGQIYETALDIKEKYSKLVYDLGDKTDGSRHNPISGLEFEAFPPTQTEPTKFLVMATTTTRHYQFVGGPTFEALFANYTTNPAFVELPGDITHSELHFFAKYQGRAKSFAWLTGPGIYTGNLSFGSQNPGDSVVVDNKLLHYPKRDDLQPPISLLLTEFHFILLYFDRLQVINQLSEDIVFTYHLRQPMMQHAEKPSGGLCRDQTSKTVWMYTPSVIYQIIIEQEDRDVWQLYLKKGVYEMALQFCKDLDQRDSVLTAQAEHYYQTAKYDLAATFYAKTQRRFEEVALKFVNSGEKDALKTFLLNKLDHIDNKDKTQLTLMCTWLTEIYLDKLSGFRDDGGGDDAAHLVVEEFHQFLEDYKKQLDPATTYNLISNHGRIREMLHYAQLIGDWDRLVGLHIQGKRWNEGLSCLCSQDDPALFYKYTPVLIQNIPTETADAIIKLPALNPVKLIPALIRYEERRVSGEIEATQNEAIRYLRHCVTANGNKDPAIHNYLLSLYAKQAKGDSDELLSFLNPTEGAQTYYDNKYALRLCRLHGKTEACIYIYSKMELYEEAVDLALEVDLELAKVNADKAEDPSLRKKLWLRIARHVIEEEKNIRKAISFLGNASPLKIEDILPHFPDFVLIDDFKSEICAALEDYNTHIENLKVEMDEATASAELIRNDIKHLRNRHVFVSGADNCDICGNPILTEQFYLFPCNHKFHEECIKEELEKEVRHSDDIGAECLYCGEIMIQSVTKPLVTETPEDWEIFASDAL